MRDVAARMLKVSRRKWFQTRPSFRPHKPVTSEEIAAIEARDGLSLPDDLKGWLLEVGYGDVDETLSFRSEWFCAIEQGEFVGDLVFAQDDVGNFYSFTPDDGKVVFLSRSGDGYAIVATSFSAFMEELEHRNYQLEKWTSSLALQKTREL